MPPAVPPANRDRAAGSIGGQGEQYLRDPPTCSVGVLQLTFAAYATTLSPPCACASPVPGAKLLSIGRLTFPTSETCSPSPLRLRVGRLSRGLRGRFKRYSLPSSASPPIEACRERPRSSPSDRSTLFQGLFHTRRNRSIDLPSPLEKPIAVCHLPPRARKLYPSPSDTVSSRTRVHFSEETSSASSPSSPSPSVYYSSHTSPSPSIFEEAISSSTHEAQHNMPRPRTSSLSVLGRWRAQEGFPGGDGMPEPQIEEPRPSSRSTRPRSSSFRRAFTLIAENGQRKSVDVKPLSTPITTWGNNGRSSWSYSKRASRSSTTAGVLTTPSHYNDQDARLTLKSYLASPQKFEEMLEHGFPANPKVIQVQEPPQIPKQSFAARRASSDANTFLKEQTLSFLDDSDDTGYDDYADELDDDDSNAEDYDGHSPEISSPITPRDADSFRSPSMDPFPGQLTSIDSTGLPLHSPSRSKDIRAATWAGSREMTMRMTLTKPELRDSEDAIYGWQKQLPLHPDDPLALDALPQIEPSANARASPKGAQDSGKVRNLWKKMKQQKR